MTRLSIYADEPWDRVGEQMRIRTRFFGKPLGAKELGSSLHELLPGSTGFHLHAHYGMEEMFFVLSGAPTLRRGADEDDERLAPGDVVFCPRGLAGLHTFTNPTDEPARILAVSTAPTPEVVVYPELKKVWVVTRDPFETPEGADPGIVASFDWPAET